MPPCGTQMNDSKEKKTLMYSALYLQKKKEETFELRRQFSFSCDNYKFYRYIDI